MKLLYTTNAACDRKNAKHKYTKANNFSVIHNNFRGIVCNQQRDKLIQHIQ